MRRPEPARIARLVDEHGVDTLHASASLLNFLFDEHPAMFARLRQVPTGGEVASVEHIGCPVWTFGACRCTLGRASSNCSWCCTSGRTAR